MRVAFLDRDGTLIWEPPDDKQVDSLDKLRILPGVVRGLQTLQARGYNLVMVTNQDGLGTESFQWDDFQIPQDELLRRLAQEGIQFLEVFVCPHREEDGCQCRKPATGQVDDFVKENPLDGDSFVLGDRETDRLFAERLGIKGLQMQTNSAFPRFGFVTRTTRETQIEAFLNLDGAGDVKVRTGIGFFEHMLEALAHHSRMDLDLRAVGDLQVDKHHTIEDCALVLGEAIEQALGNKRGIERFGSWVPMDEALAHAVIDLSGRPYLVFEGSFSRDRVGEMPTEMVEHFFYSLAQGMGCTWHLELVRGKNDHHKIEALFKGAGRALGEAIRRHSGTTIPSTKGTLGELKESE